MGNLKSFQDFKGDTNLPEKVEEHQEGLSNYMFFQNLKTIKESVESMLSLDQAAVDAMLTQHDWASDHIATSKDDVEEVCNFMCNMLKNTNQ